MVIIDSTSITAYIPLMALGAFLSFYGVHLLDKKMRDSIGSIIDAFTNVHPRLSPAILETNLLAQDELEKLNKIILGLQQSNNQYQLVFGATPDCILLVNKSLEIVLANDAAADILGYQPEELQGQSVDLFLPEKMHASHRHLAQQFMNNPIAKGMGHRPILEVIAKDGHLVAVEISLNPLPAPNNDKIAVVIRDARQRSEYQNRIQHLLHYDTLTELPNRRLFEDRLNQAISRADKHQQQVNLVIIGLDGFKTINDVLGHEVGDQVLSTIAARLTDHLESHRTVARIGGDEFAIVSEDPNSPHVMPVLLERITAAVVKPIREAGQTLKLTASLGIATYPIDADNGRDLLKNADIALMQAKQAGRGKFNFYNSEISPEIKDKLEIDNQLRHALAKSECKVHYQPIVELESQKIVAAEALLRWNNSKLGQVPPDRFIPVAENNGLIRDLDQWTRRMAFSHAQFWAQDGKAIAVSVNVSAVDFEQTSLAHDIIQIIKNSELDPSMVSLEITESMLMKDPEHASDALQLLRNSGIKVAIDDFGTGYSCLAHLQTFPVNRLKIDRAFVSNMLKDANAKKIIAAIISLAHTLDMEVVAEGIETEPQRQELINMGCKLGQGYLFYAPMPADQFTELIAKQQQDADIDTAMH
ncbi:EAL domain-containing protein [Leeia sp. TBRC 13508]|uniref:EAL domain-containing protein n=1 Tax=Leeia speluncae TaxID=2884804 RepID=A0ABS8DAD4_9NEIS|nr:EAL domain-containing protein [Leeia speluncae]MCB6185169.1 EAL domain-containing protein [Leeia speluncae]